MGSKITLAVWANAGIGGTEKAAVLFSVELARRGHRVIYLSPPGPRDVALEQGKVSRANQPGSANELVDFIRSERIDVIHQHVPGYAHHSPIYAALELLGDRRPRLIETNVFGRMEDEEGDRWVDFRCFISRSSAVQAFQRRGRKMNAAALAKSTVLSYPLAPLTASPTEALHSRERVRKEFGIGPEDILILRFGRPGGKWTYDEVAVFQRARRRNRALRMLLMEPREEIWNEVEAGRWGEGIILHRAVFDFDRLSAIYTAGDLMLLMPKWGESFGYTIAEAMQNGIPMVTRSTPWADNAQVELVEHGVSGFVCNSRGGATECVVRLAGDSSLRRRMGGAGVERITRLSNLEEETDLLEEILLHVVHGAPLQKVAARNRNLLEFQSSFAALENTVCELDSPRLRFSYLQGASYRAYRTLHGLGSRVKGALKKRSR